MSNFPHPGEDLKNVGESFDWRGVNMSTFNC